MKDLARTRAGRDEPVARHQIDASPDDVFAAWVTPQILETWWGPEGFTTTVRRLDLVEGGRFAFEMTAPDGASCVMTGVYKKIDRPTLLVFEIIDHCNLNLPHGVRPQQEPSLVTVRFSDCEGKTEIAVSHSLLNAEYAFIAVRSWSSAIAKISTSIRSCS